MNCSRSGHPAGARKSRPIDSWSARADGAESKRAKSSAKPEGFTHCAHSTSKGVAQTLERLDRARCGSLSSDNVEPRKNRAVVGRSHELRELESGLVDAAGGSGGLFLLVGEPGIGKTRLADEVTRDAKERGFTAHWGRCWEVGGAPAFWPWIQIFRSMLRDARSKPVTSAYADVLSRLLPELRGGELPAPELDQAQARFQLFDEIWALLRAVAEQAPLLLVL